MRVLDKDSTGRVIPSIIGPHMCALLRTVGGVKVLASLEMDEQCKSQIRLKEQAEFLGSWEDNTGFSAREGTQVLRQMVGY